MTRPAQGQLGWDSVVLPNGDYALLSLKAVEDGAAAVDENIAQTYSGSVGSRELGAALQDLRDRAEVELHPENI